MSYVIALSIGIWGEKERSRPINEIGHTEFSEVLRKELCRIDSSLRENILSTVGHVELI